ncbi:MAG: EamA family transporter [Chloroflexi bacterium]|nr:EamA family transporter [Chloroflexota bacterium]MBP8057838.1 EamA family transporter [Chloroflexota bacterium]
MSTLPASPLAAPTRRTHLSAILQAVLVTFLWSTSWVLIKIGLQVNLPALTFAGLRYTLAFLCLAPLVLSNRQHRATLRQLPRATWGQLLLLGVVYYAVTQGSQFVGLSLLPAATLNLLLNLTSLVVGLMNVVGGQEKPTSGQWAAMGLSAVGVLVYFLPLNLPPGIWLGLAVATVGVVANAWGSVLGRKVNQAAHLPPLLVTFVSMGIGAVLLLVVGGVTQGFGTLQLQQWLIIGWLAVVNTAFAFTLWNRTLQTLTAVESSMINSLMLPQIAILAWVFLGETLTGRQIMGLLLVGLGVMLVQLLRPRGK